MIVCVFVFFFFIFLNEEEGNAPHFSSFLSFCCRVILWRIDRVENDLKSLVLDRFYGKLFQLRGN